jgi:hypothetical protein
MNGDDFWPKWDETYDKRTAVIKKFVDKYDLKVSDKYADTLKELVDNGKAAQAQNDEKDAGKRARLLPSVEHDGRWVR